MTGRPLSDLGLKLREDAERITRVPLDSDIITDDERHLAEAVLSLLDAQSGMEEALRAAGKALEPFADAARGLTSDRIDAHPIFYVPNDGRMHGTVSTLKTGDLRAAVPALASVNAVLAGKNTETAGPSSAVLAEREACASVAEAFDAKGDCPDGRNIARIIRARGSAPPLSTSALDEARSLIGRASLIVNFNAPAEDLDALANEWTVEAERWLSANPKGPKE